MLCDNLPRALRFSAPEAAKSGGSIPMSSSMRRIGVVVAAVAVLGFLSIHVAKPAWGQKLVRPIKPGPGGPPGVDPGGPTEFSHSLTLAIDPKLNKRLEAA